MHKTATRSTEKGEGSRSLRHRIRPGLLLAFVIALAAYATLAVNWYPVITPDSLEYLDHSQDLSGYGFVQSGFRQIGYPLWLAATSAIAGVFGLEPLGVAAVAQRLMLVGAMIVAIVVLRWWAIPIAATVMLPTVVASSNLLLTEAVAVPIAVATAAACVALHKPDHRAMRTVWLAVATLGAITLPIIRLHYAVITAAVALAVLASNLGGSRVRRDSAIAIAMMVFSGVALCGALAYENHNENGIFMPSLGSERARFWVSWHTTVGGHEDAFRDHSPDIYLDGNPDTFILQTDNSPISYSEQREVYADATDRMFDAIGANDIEERLKSLLGVIRGSRIDDLGPALTYAASPSAGLTPDVIHQYSSVAKVDPIWIAETYNDGREPRALLTLGRFLPAVRLPHIASAVVMIVPYVLGLSIYLMAFRRSRWLAIVSAFVVVTYALASFVYTFDNLRYLLPAYLFALVTVSGAAMAKWGSEIGTSVE
jgi:hypothetical protein